eukprot:6712_1
MTSKGNGQQTETLLFKTNSTNDKSLSPKLLFAVTASILTTFCNGLSYYGIGGSLNLFLQTELNQSKADASINTTLFTGTRFFITIVGAVIADSFLGRFKTIIIALCIFLIGTIGVAIISIQLSPKTVYEVTTTEQMLFWFALYLVAFGSGGIGPNNGSLGAEQFEFDEKSQNENIIKSEYKTMENKNEETKSKLSKYKESFFQWRYFSNNCATLLSYSVIAYLCQDISFGIGYSIPAIVILFGLIIFILPSKVYYKFKPKGSVLIKFLKILFYILCKQNKKLRRYKWREIQDVKNMLSIFPFWICYVIYFSVWSQLNTLIYAQGCQLNYHIDSLNWNFPITALSIFGIITVLILIPLFDRYLFPMFRKYGIKVTMLRKMGAGFIFAILSMICAGIVEIYRKNASLSNIHVSVCNSNDDEHRVYVSNLSIFWQIPSFILAGISEVLTSITGSELFFNEAPKSMKSVMAAVYRMAIGFGSYLTAVYIMMVNVDKNNKWITDDLNDGHVDWYFFVIAAFITAAFFIFLWNANKYEYKITIENNQVKTEGNEIDDF